MNIPHIRTLHQSSKLKEISYMGLLFLTVIVFGTLIHSATETILGADYYTFWMGGRAAFIEHQTPYSQEVTERIQIGKLGRLATSEEDQMAFAYPPYSLLMIFPTVFLSFDWATSFWLAFNIIALLTTLFLIGSKNKLLFTLTIFLFYPVFLNLVLGTFDTIMLVGMLLFFGVLIKEKEPFKLITVLTGVLLAWSTMKPQFVWLVIPFILLYALRERYWLFLKTFAVTLVVNLLFSFVLIPDWVSQWFHQVQAYRGYVKSQPTLTEFLRLYMQIDQALLLTGIVFLLFAGVAILLLIRWWKGELHWLKVLAWLVEDQTRSFEKANGGHISIDPSSS